MNINNYKELEYKKNELMNKINNMRHENGEKLLLENKREILNGNAEVPEGYHIINTIRKITKKNNITNISTIEKTEDIENIEKVEDIEDIINDNIKNSHNKINLIKSRDMKIKMKKMRKRKTLEEEKDHIFKI